LRRCGMPPPGRSTEPGTSIHLPTRKGDTVEKVNVNRTDLIAAVQKKIDEAKADREAKVQKAEDRLDNLVLDLSVFERRSVSDFIANKRSSGSWDSDPTDREASGYKSAPDENPDAAKFNPDEDLERIVRVLSMSPDETVELETTDDLYDLV
jgi:hypothetical protein